QVVLQDLMRMGPIGRNSPRDFSAMFGLRPFGRNKHPSKTGRYDRKRPTGLMNESCFMIKGEQTRKKIVQAAAPIFNQRGYEGSSLNDLMEATGLQKGGIYRHFTSKEELAAEAFDYTWEAVWSARLLYVDEKARGIDKLKQLIANF